MPLVILLLLFLFGCSPNSSEDFQHEGASLCRALVSDLQHIENREQLLRAEPQLKKRFEDLIDLMIQAREFQQKHLDEGDSVYQEDQVDALLEDELRRVYTIEGARELIERTQQEALIRLDAYERTLSKKLHRNQQ